MKVYSMVPIRKLPIVAFLLLSSTLAVACPFCSTVSQTFTEEMATMDVVALVELVKAASVTEINTADPNAPVPQSRFRITELIKGDSNVRVGDEIDTIYFGEARKGRSYLCMATSGPNLNWSTPLILTDRAKSYIEKLDSLPDDGTRLEFFQQYLEDEDETLARDAYDEFAKASYESVIALKDKMDREQLLEFIQDPEVPSNHRQLYFTMLGVCGKPEDAKLLESLMTSGDRKKKAGLDAMIACYLILKGEPGLVQVEKLFLQPKDSEYSDTYAAIMAIRFHGNDVDYIPRTRLVKSLRYMLERAELADLVIPDLARWEDWDSMPRLVELFKQADESSSWVRVPVINYLRACPLPKAQETIDQLRQIDEDAVNRALTYFPLDTSAEGSSADGSSAESTDAQSKSEEVSQPTVSPEKTSRTDQPKPVAQPENGKPQTLLASVSTAVETRKVVSPTDGSPVSQATSANHDTTGAIPANGTAQIRLADENVKAAEFMEDSIDNVQQLAGQVVNRSRVPGTLSQAEMLAERGANPWVLFGVTLVSGAVAFVLMRMAIGVGDA